MNGTRSRQFSTPLFIDHLDETGSAVVLDPITVSRTDADEIQHDERWLQKLIYDFPQILPISEIEPGFSQLVPVCLELPTDAGYVDNLFITATGDLVLAECKLWRNPQARREVVAQIIDYAHSMARWSYSDLESAVRKTECGDTEGDRGGLFQLVQETGEIDEASFIDAVSRNLRLGRMLLLIIGDGIREGVETLSDYLQAHAGFHFTLGIVEMPVYRLPREGFVVQPRVLARTVNIERGIVRLEGSGLVVEPPGSLTTKASNQRRTSISQERLLETLASQDPMLPAMLNQFLDRVSDLRIVPEMATKSLLIRWQSPDGRQFTLGGVADTGDFITYMVNWGPNGIGRLNLSHEYLENVAALLGASVRRTTKPAMWYVAVDETKNPKAISILQKQDGWIEIIKDYIDKLSAVLPEAAGS